MLNCATTPNRGGFILGLDDFYSENLVPGAIISIQRTENDGHYRVEYLAEAAHSDQLLELDERRATRYVFRPTTYACGVEDAHLLSESRFGGMVNESRSMRRCAGARKQWWPRRSSESDSSETEITRLILRPCLPL